MADVITRFKLETSQYDSKLRDSAKSLAAYSKQAEMAGKDFEFMFYLDFEASVYSEEVIMLLCELDAEPTEFAYLGTYI